MRAVIYSSEHSQHVAVLGNPGRKFTKMVVVDHPIHMTKILNDSAEKYSREMPDITLKQTCRKLLAAGKRMGITKGARALLNEGRV